MQKEAKIAEDPVAMEEPPIIDMKIYLNKEPGWEEECKKVIESFH